MYAGFGRLYGIELIVDGRCRTREVMNFVDFDVQGKCDVMAHNLKIRVVEQMPNVSARSCEIIVDANDLGAAKEQPLTKMRADKPCPSCHQHALVEVHQRHS